MSPIALIESDPDIDRCPVMLELSPHRVQAEFVQQVRRQQQHGYPLCHCDCIDPTFLCIICSRLRSALTVCGLSAVETHSQEPPLCLPD